MTQNNLKVAITGGIGSGKSTVTKFIAQQGYKVISCDKIYGQLLTDKSFLNKLSNEFGDVLTAEGKLNRSKLSTIVFADSSKLKKLNELTHPAIMSEALKQMSGGGISFCEVPLLFEGGFENLFDDVIVVLRNKEIRAAAVSKRDNVDVKDVITRINSQFDYDKSLFEKYYVIHNNSDLANLRIETLNIIKKLINNNLKKFI